MFRLRNKIFWSPDDGGASGAFTPAAEEDEDGPVEVIFTPDGLPPADPNAAPEPAKPDFEATLAAKLAELQAAQQTPVAQTNQDALIEALKSLQQPKEAAKAAPGDPIGDFKKFVQEQKNTLYKNPDTAIEQIMEKYTQTIVGPALQHLQQQNMGLQAMLNKQTVSQSPMNKQIMEDYGSEVEKRAKELQAQGVAEPYNRAVQEVGFAHMSEITQKQVQAAIAEATKPKEQPPVAGLQPNGTAAPAKKRSVVLSEADKARADEIGMDHVSYARAIGKL